MLMRWTRQASGALLREGFGHRICAVPLVQKARVSREALPSLPFLALSHRQLHSLLTRLLHERDASVRHCRATCPWFERPALQY